MKTLCIVLISLFSVFVLFSLVYLFLISTSKKRRSEALQFANYRYAHRGLFDASSPENSLSAFEKAIRAGYGIELDVRLSSDGTLVVFHDDTLERMTGESGAVSSKTAEELSKIPLLSSHEKIPSFDEVLALVDGKVPLLVEIKEAKGSTAVTEAVCERLSSYNGRYIIESFNPMALASVRKLLPTAIVGILSEHFTAEREMRTGLFYLLQSMVTNVLSRPDFVAYNHKHTRFLPFRLVRMMGALTFAYTVKCESDEEKALESDFDTVIFEQYIPKSPFIDSEKK